MSLQRPTNSQYFSSLLLQLIINQVKMSYDGLFIATRCELPTITGTPTRPPRYLHPVVRLFAFFLLARLCLSGIKFKVPSVRCNVSNYASLPIYRIGLDFVSASGHHSPIPYKEIALHCSWLDLDRHR